MINGVQPYKSTKNVVVASGMVQGNLPATPYEVMAAGAYANVTVEIAFAPVTSRRVPLAFAPVFTPAIPSEPEKWFESVNGKINAVVGGTASVKFLKLTGSTEATISAKLEGVAPASPGQFLLGGKVGAAMNEEKIASARDKFEFAFEQAALNPVREATMVLSQKDEKVTSVARIPVRLSREFARLRVAYRIAQGPTETFTAAQKKEFAAKIAATHARTKQIWEQVGITLIDVDENLRGTDRFDKTWERTIQPMIASVIDYVKPKEGSPANPADLELESLGAELFNSPGAKADITVLFVNSIVDLNGVNEARNPLGLAPFVARDGNGRLALVKRDSMGRSESVTAHELGHVFGLRHTPEPKDAPAAVQDQYRLQLMKPSTGLGNRIETGPVLQEKGASIDQYEKARDDAAIIDLKSR